MQGPDYRGRVRLLKMRKGDVSLLLERVTTSDKGIYTCHVSSGDWYDELSMQLLVTSTFKLIVPSEPVAASVASDVVLPCQLSPEMSAAAMDVRWYRENFENLVFLYKEGKETEGSGYRGRVRLFKQEMERGNVSLLLQNVRISDQGSYTCHVSSAEWYEEPKLGLRVRRQGNRPEIEIGEIKKDSLKLTCHSEGWFPEPQMFWTDKGGRKLSSDVKPASQPGKDSPYSITSHLYMKKTDNEGVVCMVAQQEQKIEFGSRLRISDTFFENIHPERYHLSAFLLPATLVLVCLVAVGIFVKRNKEGVQGCRLPSSGWR
nr:PREDICTED: butyrophilin subfamily 3 member A2-like [Lepisosteus oculatus]